MPNIMFFGFDGADDPELLPDKRQLVLEAMRELGLAEDAVVTTVMGECTSCNTDAKPMPFIRICGTSPTEIDRIIDALRAKNLNLDTETLLLTDFIAGGAMTVPDDDQN